MRRTPYDGFVGAIGSRVDLAGFLMTPDAAFGFERRGTPEALAELGRRDGFDVVVVPPFTLDGRPVRSSDIRSAIAAGDLATASELLGREITVTGAARSDDGGTALEFDMPMALPPAGAYRASTNGRGVELEVGEDGTARVRPAVDGAADPLRVVVSRCGSSVADRARLIGRALAESACAPFCLIASADKWPKPPAAVRTFAEIRPACYHPSVITGLV